MLADWIPNIFLTVDGCATTLAPSPQMVRIPVLTLVSTLQHQANVAAKLLTLTRRELHVATMHLVDGRSQKQIAAWLNLSLRYVQRAIRSAVRKVPELAPLRVKRREKPPRPRVVHLSQLSVRDKSSGLFNADEL
jgi:DNA-directed RNA polymerase specialized sigma24 family protein